MTPRWSKATRVVAPSTAHQFSQSRTSATLASRPGGGRTGSAAILAPSALASRQVRVVVPACGRTAESNFSAPEVDWRHWKNMIPVGAASDALGGLGGKAPGQLGGVGRAPVDWLVACSITKAAQEEAAAVARGLDDRDKTLVGKIIETFGGGYDVSHDIPFWIVDKQGMMRVSLEADATPADIASDVKALIAE